MDVSPVLVADLQAPEAVEPGERPFDHPAVASQAVLGLDTTAGDAGARNLFLAVAPLMGYGAVAFDPTPGSCYNGGVKGVFASPVPRPCDTLSIQPCWARPTALSGGRRRPVAVRSWRPRLPCGPVWGSRVLQLCPLPPGTRRRTPQHTPMAATCHFRRDGCLSGGLLSRARQSGRCPCHTTVSYW